MTNQYILSVIVAIALSACNHQNDDIGWKLRNPEEEAKEEIITDSSTRFVSKNVAMRYDDGGILVNKSDSEIKFASLITGEEIILTYNDGDYTDNAKLKINGNEAPIKSIEVLREEKTDVWIRVITDDRDSVSIVVTDISYP